MDIGNSFENNGKNPISRAKAKNKKGKNTGIIVSLMIVMIFAIVWLSFGIINIGADALANGYNEAYAKEKESVYQSFYNKFYDKAKNKYLVSNRAHISIGDVKEVGRLEVLKVSDVEFVIKDSKDNSNNITSWLEVPGQGTFVVDLEAAEFIVDDERYNVLVRVPYPELTNITIDYKNVKSLLFENDIFDDSYMVGEDLARSQLNEGDMLIKKEFTSNQNFFLSAQDAARNSIICLVNQMNPEIKDLSVDVEFY